MASIDERIKAELENSEGDFATEFTDTKGLNDMVWDAYKSGPRRWLTFTGVAMCLLSVVLVYLLVKFVGADVAVDKVYWGVWSVLTLMVILGLELWSWMQVNRFATMREIKQMEASIRQLLEKE